MRIGLLTGGGDCPGLNAAIRAVVWAGASFGDEIVGFHHGWRGVVEGDASTFTVAETKGLLQSGGTILRTARFHPDEHEGGVAAVIATLERERLDALIVVGGDGTLGSASYLAETRRTDRRHRQDDRQRRGGDEALYRFRHCSGDRGGGHRPGTDDR